MKKAREIGSQWSEFYTGLKDWARKCGASKAEQDVIEVWKLSDEKITNLIVERAMALETYKSMSSEELAGFPEQVSADIKRKGEEAKEFFANLKSELMKKIKEEGLTDTEQKLFDVIITLYRDVAEKINVMHAKAGLLDGADAKPHQNTPDQQMQLLAVCMRLSAGSLREGIAKAYVGMIEKNIPKQQKVDLAHPKFQRYQSRLNKNLMS